MAARAPFLSTPLLLLAAFAGLTHVSCGQGLPDPAPDTPPGCAMKGYDTTARAWLFACSTVPPHVTLVWLDRRGGLARPWCLTHDQISCAPLRGRNTNGEHGPN